jgi:micrococcal nuclease
MFSYQAKLIEVIDGHTVDLLVDLGFGVHVKERFRLYGIDAPEMPTEAGKIAKAYLESILGTAIELYVATRKMIRRPQEKTDKYGRYLAVLYDNYHDVEADVDETKINMMPTSINLRMTYTGHAKERYWK